MTFVTTPEAGRAISGLAEDSDPGGVLAAQTIELIYARSRKATGRCWRVAYQDPAHLKTAGDRDQQRQRGWPRRRRRIAEAEIGRFSAGAMLHLRDEALRGPVGAAVMTQGEAMCKPAVPEVRLLALFTRCRRWSSVNMFERRPLQDVFTAVATGPLWLPIVHRRGRKCGTL